MNTIEIIQNKIPLDRILPNPEQPRKVFDEGELLNLAASIREHGIIEPVVVEQAGENFILHDGERRLRAARLAGLVDIPATVVPPLKGSGTQDRLTRAVVANVQRVDMNPIEEGKAFQRMRDEFGWSPAEISRKTGVYPKRIYDTLNLMRLEPELQQLIAKGKMGHDANMIKAFLDIPDSAGRISLVKGLSIRKTTNKGSILAAQRLTEVLKSKTSIKEHCPSMATAGRLSKTDTEEQPRRWNAMMELGSVPPWGILSKVAFDTCEECELKSMASPVVCNRCQLVDMLRKLLEAAK